MKNLQQLQAEYNQVKQQWDAAIVLNDGPLLETLTDNLLDKEDAFRIAFLNYTQLNSSYAEFKQIKEIAYSEQFINHIAKASLAG